MNISTALISDATAGEYHFKSVSHDRVKEGGGDRSEADHEDEESQHDQSQTSSAVTSPAAGLGPLLRSSVRSLCLRVALEQVSRTEQATQ